MRQLHQASGQTELEMNLQKTKVMRKEDRKIKIDNQTIENIDHYTYLGPILRLGREN